MKIIFPGLFFLALCLIGSGQSLSPQVLSSAGGFSTSSTNTFSYTVGEMTMVQTFSSGNIILTQGFQQTESSTSAVQNLPADLGSFSLYPNPTTDKLNYSYQFTGRGKVSTCIYNSLGQRMEGGYDGEYTDDKETRNVNVGYFPAGIYFLTLCYTSTTNNQTYIISQKFQVIN